MKFQAFKLQLKGGKSKNKSLTHNFLQAHFYFPAETGKSVHFHFTLKKIEMKSSPIPNLRKTKKSKN